jgi:uncharacterized protein
MVSGSQDGSLAVSAEEVEFFQLDGYRLRGDLYAKQDGQPSGAVIFCHGYGGTKQYIAPDLAKGLVERLGCSVLAFDYSGFGASEGPRGRLDPHRQVQDTHAAVSWTLATTPELASRVAIFGISFGGAVAAATTFRDERVRALVTLSMFSSGARWMRDLRPQWQWMEFQEAIAADRVERTSTGASRSVDPDWILQRDPTSAAFNRQLLEEFPERRFELDVASAELIDTFEPMQDASGMNDRPTLLIHCTRDRLIPVEYSREAAELLGGDLVEYPDWGHYDLYDGAPREALLDTVAGWLASTWETATSDPRHASAK